MHDRSQPIVVTPRACPFVALDGDRDRRLDTPDPLHRCFAEQIPRARSISHQADYCLSPAFTGCPIFQDWATRAAAEPVTPAVPGAPLGAPTTDRRTDGTTTTPSVTSPTFPAPDRPSTTDDGTGTIALPRPTRAREAQAADEELLATRPVPSYRAVPPTSSVPTSSSVPPTTTTPTTRPSRVEPETIDPVAGTASSVDPDDDIPVIRSMPASLSRPAAPPVEDDWAAPPPWLRQPPGPVWIAEAMPPPDALAEIGTQPVRRPRRTEPSPPLPSEAAAPGDDLVFGMPGAFGEDTTGMPYELPPIERSAAPSRAADVPDAGVAAARSTGTGAATGAAAADAAGSITGTQPTDPGLSAELAASRYRADVAAGLITDDEVGTGSQSGATSRGRRVPIDVQASSSLESRSQARPTVRSTGSREWEGPRRFEAYAATQRRRPPTSIIVGGSAIALVVVLLGVFLLPGMFMGGGAAPTAQPDPSAGVAAVVATDAPAAPTQRAERTEEPERTPKPRIYTVKAGDTLIKIARRFKVRVDRITCLNRIRNPNNVAVGRRLTIPPKGYRCPSD